MAQAQRAVQACGLSAFRAALSCEGHRGLPPGLAVEMVEEEEAAVGCNKQFADCIFAKSRGSALSWCEVTGADPRKIFQ